jgi:hypothetical protein
MGKRCKKRNQSKNHQKSQTREDPSSDSGLSFSETSILDSPKDSYFLLKQVKSYISEIYSEHKDDLEQRKHKRILSKKPTDYFSPYNLVVNWQFQQRIRKQIQDLIKSSLGDLLKDSVLSCMSDFINYLSSFLKDFEGKKRLLRAIMLYEAYHTLNNSISQVGSIVSELICKYSFEVQNKKLFYEKVAFGYFDLIEEVRKWENSKYVEDLIKLRLDLQEIEKGVDESQYYRMEYASTVHSDSGSEGEGSIDALHNLSIEELVRVIGCEDGPKKKKKTKKRKNKEQISVVNEEIDLEVKRLSLTLDEVKIAERRQKPAVSEKFLLDLKERLRVLQMSKAGNKV